MLLLSILASNNNITNVCLGLLTNNSKEISTTGCSPGNKEMKTLDYFKSYYVSIGGTGFNLKILPALAKVKSLVSHMKLGKNLMWEQQD